MQAPSLCFLWLGFCLPRSDGWWLASLAVLSIMMSWGKSFPAFNYFLFDYPPVTISSVRNIYTNYHFILHAFVGHAWARKLMSTSWIKRLKQTIDCAGIPNHLFVLLGNRRHGQFYARGREGIAHVVFERMKADRKRCCAMMHSGRWPLSFRFYCAILSNVGRKYRPSFSMRS